MNNADEIVLIGRLLDRDPQDSPVELEQELARCMDLNALRAFARESGLVRLADLAPVRVQAGA